MSLFVLRVVQKIKVVKALPSSLLDFGILPLLQLFSLGRVEASGLSVVLVFRDPAVSDLGRTPTVGRIVEAEVCFSCHPSSVCLGEGVSILPMQRPTQRGLRSTLVGRMADATRVVLESLG